MGHSILCVSIINMPPHPLGHKPASMRSDSWQNFLIAALSLSTSPLDTTAISFGSLIVRTLSRPDTGPECPAALGLVDTLIEYLGNHLVSHATHKL